MGMFYNSKFVFPLYSKTGDVIVRVMEKPVEVSRYDSKEKNLNKEKPSKKLRRKTH
jgi:hypothetical protein